MSNNTYESIKLLYDQAKDEYNYQRERLQKIESKVELIITFVGSIFTFEISNAKKLLNFSYSSDLINTLKALVKSTINNIPYLLSLILIFISVIILLVIFFNVKCRIVSIVKLYNDKNYHYNENDYTKYLTALYVRCISYNYTKINYLYKLINGVVILSIISIISFGIAYLF